MKVYPYNILIYTILSIYIYVCVKERKKEGEMQKFYLSIITDIVTKTDKASFKFFRFKAACSVLVKVVK